ncbi:hypothetical protein [Bradyrhizobium sp. CCBAU 51765]|uniref:hypothetical protein n=1 Tax=Bradyrhizobium sp. CCBAU 51765 TaxID=1325102 RepID=UPI0018882893|nr:hypothetical protein [Bradyrhizobium sp. CCBAU 51765]QOZ09257.1 hypothetical protein XH96_18260 [Bradyrhizobium sp. CCBAU 51765]
MLRPKRATPTHPDGRQMKITFGQMRAMGLRGVLVYCHCGHHVALDSARWPDEVRLSDIEPRFVCQGCGSRGADVRPDFDRGNPRLAITGS